MFSSLYLSVVQILTCPEKFLCFLCCLLLLCNCFYPLSFYLYIFLGYVSFVCCVYIHFIPYICNPGWETYIAVCYSYSILPIRYLAGYTQCVLGYIEQNLLDFVKDFRFYNTLSLIKLPFQLIFSYLWCFTSYLYLVIIYYIRYIRYQGNKSLDEIQIINHSDDFLVVSNEILDVTEHRLLEIIDVSMLWNGILGFDVIEEVIRDNNPSYNGYPVDSYIYGIFLRRKNFEVKLFYKIEVMSFTIYKMILFLMNYFNTSVDMFIDLSFLQIACLVVNVKSLRRLFISRDIILNVYLSVVDGYLNIDKMIEQTMWKRFLLKQMKSSVLRLRSNVFDLGQRESDGIIVQFCRNRNGNGIITIPGLK